MRKGGPEGGKQDWPRGGGQSAEKIGNKYVKYKIINKKGGDGGHEKITELGGKIHYTIARDSYGK